MAAMLRRKAIAAMAAPTGGRGVGGMAPTYGLSGIATHSCTRWRGMPLSGSKR